MSTLVWARPLPPGAARDQWIDCVMRMVDHEIATGDDHLTSHYVFVKKVLRESDPAMLPVQFGARFRDTPLTREKCHEIADNWWEPPSNDGESRNQEPS